MADTSIEVATTIPAAQVARIFRDTMSSISRKVEFGTITPDDSPFAALEAQPVFAAWASLASFPNVGNWGIQIYIYEESSGSKVRLEVLGDSMLKRSFAGTKSTLSRKSGEAKASLLLDQLRLADPRLRVQY